MSEIRDDRLQQTTPPEEIQESKGLYDHPNEWVFEKDEQNATEKAYRSTQFLLASKEIKCFLGSNDECET